MNEDEQDRSDTVETGGTERKTIYRGYLWLIVAAFIFGAMFYLYSLPGRGIGPLQPIAFSHRVHAGAKDINCRFCHAGAERSANAGLPSLEKCFYCHKYIIPNHPEIVKEDRYYRSGKPVPWERIFWVADFVYFDHVPHLKWGKLDCADCHGDVKSMDRLKKVDFEMGFCLDCHRKKKAQQDCWLACHR